MDKQLIVGVDPGTTVGLAFLDVDGNILKVTSLRNMSIDSIITEIATTGKAIIIASDKAIVPPAINKLASILSARVFCPDSDLLVERKRELASKVKTNNDHERDALAAAVYSYNKFQNKIRRIEKQVQSELETIKGKVLAGEKVSDIFSAPQGAEKDFELLAQIRSLQKENRDLISEVEYLRKKSSKPVHSILKEAAKEAKGLISSVAKGDLVLLKEVPTLNFLDLKGQSIKNGDYILCKSKENDNKGLRYLESKGVGAIIGPKEVDTLAPSCTLNKINIISWEGLFFAGPLDIQKACGKKREVAARDLEDMLIDYKKGRR